MVKPHGLNVKDKAIPGVYLTKLVFLFFFINVKDKAIPGVYLTKLVFLFFFIF
jgi:hypothetical protein